MQNVFQEFKEIVSGVIAKVIIPLLPLYIFGIFLGMTFSGEAYHILLVFAQIILVILVLHIVILLYEYLLAGGLSHKNPFKLLLNMLPAYFTALGTSSSAATIPVTLKQTLKNGSTGRSRHGSARSASFSFGFQCRYADAYDSPLYCDGQFRHRLQCNRRWRHCYSRG